MGYQRRSVSRWISYGSELAAWFIADDRIKNYETRGVAFRSAGEKPRYRNVKNTARKELGGVWNGKIVRYDWSGKKVVEEKSLSLQLDFNNDRLSGTWTQEDSIQMKVRGHLEDSMWVFDDMTYMDMTVERPWQIKSGGFKIDTLSNGELLKGTIKQFSSAMNEPSSPTMIELRRSAYADNGDEEKEDMTNDVLTGLSISPNPFDNNINVSYSLATAQKLRVSIYTMDGTEVFADDWECDKGSQMRTVCLDVAKGSYTMSITGENVNLNRVIVKK